MDHLEAVFPALRGSGYVVTSPADDRSNCVAWAAHHNERWWWPDGDSYWPEGAPREETIAAFIAAYRELGFVSCDDPLVEVSYEKVAIYAAPDGLPTHVARQLPSGLWTSKLGQLQDIQQQLEDLAGAVYGSCTHFMKRSRPHPG